MNEPGPDVDDGILAYYAEGREQARLTMCRLEFLRTQELLHRFLPATPAAVLDVGGGAGAHALPLLEHGYDVTLVDPVALHVRQAQAAGVPKAENGDARNLRFVDSSFHAVLLLGPLYHLVARGERLAALREARRVVRPGGIVLAAVISRFASTADGLLQGLLRHPEFEEIVDRDVASGIHLNPSRRRGWFTTAYFHRPEEVAAEIADAGLGVEAVLAIEGPASTMLDVDGWLDGGDTQDRLLRAIRRVEAEPSLLGASSHLLAVARRVE